MKLRLVAVWLCSILLLTSLDVRAQQAATPNQSWDVLQQTLSAGKVMIEKKNGKKVTGELKTSSDTELVIERRGKDVNIQRQDVKKVWTVGPPNRFKRTVFGVAGFTGGLFAGAVIAVGLGFKQCDGSCADEGTGIIAALIGLPIAGIFAGHWLAGSGKRTLIYSAR